LTIEVDVLNEGPAAGEETVFLFARDMVASVVRPLLELKGVGKTALRPGERGTVCFRLAAAALSFPGSDLKPVLEPGEFPALRQMLTIEVRALPR
jgi:beta-glucosidase